jgi:hypothetical protein
MAGHGTTTISSSHELPIINPSPHCSRASKFFIGSVLQGRQTLGCTQKLAKSLVSQ